MRAFDPLVTYGKATLDSLFTGTAIEGPVPGVALCGGALLRFAIGAPPADYDVLVPSGEWADVYDALHARGVVVRERAADGTVTRTPIQPPWAADKVTVTQVPSAPGTGTRAATFKFHTGETVDIIEYPTKDHDTLVGALLFFLGSFDIRVSAIAVPWVASTLIGPGVDDLLGWSHVILHVAIRKPTTEARIAKYRTLLDAANVPTRFDVVKIF